MKNDLEDKLIGNALSYQETLSKLLGPLNEINPIAKLVEQQQKVMKGTNMPMDEFQKKLQFVEKSVKDFEPALRAVSEISNEKKNSACKGNLKNSIAEICAESKSLSVPNINPVVFISHRDLQMDAMRQEISELREEIKAGKEKDKQEFNYSPQELQVLAYSKQFQKDYNKLIEIGYMRHKEDGFLEWLKSKQSLAEYFGSQEKHGRWCDIENLFQQKGLNHLLSVANSKSKDFQKLEKLLEM